MELCLEAGVGLRHIFRRAALTEGKKFGGVRRVEHERWSGCSVDAPFIWKICGS